MTFPLAFPTLGATEILLILGVGLLIFGARRLPELGRSLGKGIVEFKKGIKGIEDDTEGGSSGKGEPPNELPRPPQRVTAPAPRFDKDAADKPAAHS